MKKVLYFFITAALTLTSCARLDELQKQLDEQQQRIACLEQLCSRMNININDLSTIVSALDAGDTVSGVTPVIKDGIIIGYTITFRKADPITIYNGTDGATPMIGLRECDGRWYWTLEGKWLLDDKGCKIPMDGITPQLKIENEKWYVSYDKGLSWEELGSTSSEAIFKEIKVEGDKVIFCLADGTAISMKIESTLLPTGIVMLTGAIEELHKGDTTFMDIRVNPSDYELSADKVDLMIIHDTYTCFSEGVSKYKELIPKYDETVVSNFKTLDIKPLEDIEGGYRVAFAVSGSGNYYDDAALYLTVSAKDSEGKEKSTCSSMPCIAHVTPTIEEGIFVEALPQSMYRLDVDNMSTPTFNADDVTILKPYYIGLWSNLYINKKGGTKVYDRTSLKVSSIADTTFSTLDTKPFKEYGYVRLTPDMKSRFWSDVEKAKDSLISITVPQSTITITGSGDRNEKAVMPFNYTYYLKSCSTTIGQFNRSDLGFRQIETDLSAFRDSTGIKDFKHGWFTELAIAGANQACQLESTDFDVNPFIATLTIGTLSTKNKSFMLAIRSFCYEMKCGQDPDGNPTDGLYPDDRGPILECDIVHQYRILD